MTISHLNYGKIITLATLILSLLCSLEFDRYGGFATASSAASAPPMTAKTPETQKGKEEKTSWFSNRRNARKIRLNRRQKQQEDDNSNSKVKEEKEEGDKSNDGKSKDVANRSDSDKVQKKETEKGEEDRKDDDKDKPSESKDENKHQTENDEKKDQQQQQQTPPTVVLLGASPSPPPGSTPPPGMFPLQSQPPPPQSIPLSALFSPHSPSPYPPIRRRSPYDPTPLSPTSPDQSPSLFSILAPLASILLRLLLITLLTGPSIFGSDHVYSISPNQHYVFERYNDKYYKDELALKKLLYDHPPGDNGGVNKWKWRRILKKRRRELLKREKRILLSTNETHQVMKEQSSSTILPTTPNKYSKTVIVLEFNPDHKSNDESSSSSSSSSSPTRSAVEQLRDTISFLLHFHRHNPTLRSSLSSDSNLEIVLLLESPGGLVQEYGLASDQILRLSSEPNISLTICVDRIAASGGYMMACRSSPQKLIAAPFAILGSIGVLREAINVHDLLEKQGVQSYIFKAGKDKVPLTTFGKVTEEGMQRVQKDLNTIHELFKSLVIDARPQIALSVDRVCTGDVFMGYKAVELGLCDVIQTSDEYIMECVRRGDRVLKLHRYDRSKFGLKLSPLDLFLLRGLGGGGGGIRRGGEGVGGVLLGLLQRVIKGGNDIWKQSSSSPFVKVGYTMALMKLLNRMGGNTSPSSPGGNVIM